MPQFEVMLESYTELNKNTREFRFVPVDDLTLDYKPGQFYRFVFTDQQGEFERSYSLCNTDLGEQNYSLARLAAQSTKSLPPGECQSRHLDLVISTVKGGRATALLFDCKVGMKARVSGPFGRLLIPEPLPKRLFLVATSVGIAPYMPMLSWLSSALRDQLLEVHVLFGVRDETEFIFADRLGDFARQYQGFRLRVSYSRKLPAEPAAFEYSGYVQHQLRQLDMTPETDHVLLCGNPKMVDECFADLKQAGFGVRQVIREKYVFARAVRSKESKALTAAQKGLLAEKMKKYGF
ncbi:MAG: hypothetical protein KUG79_17590 [Pseudomonadales bacterium]|nr:hypothetical protein [Pseudomonadales bacterium]